MEETEAESLKEILCHQDLLMQKLRSELEEEREASASSANEALSMILRLQAEKAAEKMEGWQYKIMTEGKMRHDEESLLLFEDLLYQKELEIASLKFQVQDFLDKLPDFTKKSSSENLVGSSSSGHVRKTSSLPTVKINEFCCQIDSSVDKESEASVGSNSDCSDEPRNKNKAFNLDNSAPEPNANVSENRDRFYRQVVKEEEEENDDDDKIEACEDQNPSNLLLRRPKAQTGIISPLIDAPTTLTATSMDTRDIFEVPHYHRPHKSDTESKALTMEPPPSSSLCPHGGCWLSSSSSSNAAKKEIILNDYQHSRKQRRYFVDAELKQLDGRVGKLEEYGAREEHMRLLRDIHDQTKLLQVCFANQINNNNNNNNNNNDVDKKRKKKMDSEESFVYLMEAMPSFWI